MTQQKTNGGIHTDVDVDTRITQILGINEKLEQIDNLKKPYLEAKEKLHTELLEFLERTGQKSAKTANGTVYIHVQRTASAFDPDAFMAFVQETMRLDLLERRANAQACMDYAESEGSLPPGVKINNYRTAKVRRS